MHRYFGICTDEHLLRMLAVVAVCHFLFVTVHERSCSEVVFLLCMLVGWFWGCFACFILFLFLFCMSVPCFWGGGLKKLGGGVGSMHVCVCVCGRERENACIHVSAYACVPASVCLVQVTHPTQNSSDIAVWSWQVGDLDVVLVPVSMTVIGCPLNFQMTAANPDQSTVLR